MKIELSIIIVNYRSWDKLKFCLKSILTQKQINLKVIVVDNFSNDNKLDLFKENFKWVEWIISNENLGFAKACNLGATFANSKWILFLNPDTLLVENSLSSLIKYCDNNTQHKIIGIKQLNSKNKPSNSFGLFLDLWTSNGFFRIFSRIFKGQTYKKINSCSISNPDWISGSFILLRKNDFRELNGWNESYWMYFEDMDLCKRAKNLNLKVSLLNNWKCIHFHGGSSRKNKEILIKTKIEVIKSSHIYVNAHISYFKSIIIHFLMIFFKSIELILLTPFSSTKREIFKQCIIYWKKSILSGVWVEKRSINY